MAIYHLAHSFVKRSNGSSVVSKAAYNSGAKIENNQGSTEYSDYTRKGGVLFDEISLPSGSPAWANNRGELWRRLEAREDKSTRRADAVLAHSFDIALPHELTLEQNIFLARDFVREQFTRKGYAVDWAIHAADPRGDSRNIHLHILVPLRKIEGESFGKKDRYDRTTLRQQIRSWRTSWRNIANRHLKRYGHKAMIDEHSLKAQGIKRTPTRHKGVRAKTQRKFLDKVRKAPLPKAPIVRTTKQVGKDGTITVRKVITNSALNKIGLYQPTLPLSGQSTGQGTDTRGLMPSATPVRNTTSNRGKSGNQSAAGSPPSLFSCTGPQNIRSSSDGSLGRAVKHVGKDGIVAMHATVSASELDKIKSQSEQKQQPQPCFAPVRPRRGWPSAAVADWAAWGFGNPPAFFAKWPELSVGGG